jgi:hypothetical protein
MKKRFAFGVVVSGIVLSSFIALSHKRTEKQEVAQEILKQERVVAVTKVASKKPLVNSTGRMGFVSEMPIHLQAMEQYESKALRSSAEEEEFKSLLSSEENINASLDLLKNVTQFSEGQERQRMYAISFLARALRVVDAPTRRETIAKIRQLILSPFPSDNSLKRSLAGDKVELFGVVYRQDKQAAEEILASARETSVYGIVQYAANKELSDHQFRVARK